MTPDELAIPPTEVEIAEMIEVLNALPIPKGLKDKYVSTGRRLAFQKNDLEQQLEKLKKEIKYLHS